MTEPIRVLYVGDELGFADTAATFLERRDDRFTVEIVTSTSEGIERLVEDEFDCVVSDYDMPEQTGIEFLETVREVYPDLPFLLTDAGTENVASGAISAGATDYLRKGSGTDRGSLLANRIENAVEQYRTRRRAAELDRIRTLTGDVNQALVRAESREEIDTQVCEIISNSDPYQFAWIGDVNPDTDQIEPRRSAGVDDGYLNGVTVTADDTATGQGPGGTAIRERRIAVSQDITEDPEFEPWRDEALEGGYRAVAAVPLEHGDTLYGEIVVYADRPNAFDEDEQKLLDELGGNIAHALHSIDVRDRLRTERDRRKALFENAPGPVITAEIGERGDELVMTDVNDAFENVFGYDTEEVLGEDPAKLIVPENGMDQHEEFRERAARGETIVREVERLTTEGSRTFLSHISPFTEGGDGVSGLYAWYTDISDRRARERVIERLHSTTQTFMETRTAEEIAEITVDAVHDILGMPVNGVHLYDESDGGLVPVAWTAETEAIVDELPTFAPGEGIAGTAFQTGKPQVYDDISTNSDRFNPDTDARSQIVLPLSDHGVLIIESPEIGAFDDTDVSLVKTLVAHATTALDRIEHEQELREEHDFINKALDTLGDLFYVVGQDGEMRRWNTRLPEVTGYTDDDITDMHAVEFFPEDERESVSEAIKKTLATGRATIETVVLTESGDRIPYEFTGARLTDPAGELIGSVGVGRDITERKQREAELERQNERLEEFTGVVSHDLRSPLSTASNYLSLLEAEYDDQRIQRIDNAVDRTITLVEDLLTLARQGKVVDETRESSLSDIARRAWEAVPSEEGSLIIEENLGQITADESRLRQAFENLFRNAVDHGGVGTQVRAGVLADGSGFYVSDDGPGITADQRERVFDHGYTTSDGGTGLGLAIVRRIFEAHRWQVRVTESRDGGARFEVTGVEMEQDPSSSSRGEDA